MARTNYTPDRILEAVRSRLLVDGFANLSTRTVAREAGVPLSQLHHHFGSNTGMALAAPDNENERRLSRQRTMYGQEVSLWRRYEQACDFLEDDLDSGYVRLLQEMIAAGWSDPEIAERVRKMLAGWLEVLTEVAREAETRLGSLGPFTADEIAALVSSAFLGSEAMLLLGFDRRDAPFRSALRRVGTAIRDLETATIPSAQSSS